MVLSLTLHVRSSFDEERRVAAAGAGGHADECRRRVLPRLGRAPVTVYLCQVRHRVCLKFLNTVVCFLVAGDPRSVGTPLLEEEEELLHAVGFRESVGFHCSFTSYFILHNS